MRWCAPTAIEYVHIHERVSYSGYYTGLPTQLRAFKSSYSHQLSSCLADYQPRCSKHKWYNIIMPVLHENRKEYRSAYIRKHYAANKQYYIQKATDRRKNLKKFIDELKSKPCTDCKILYKPYVMQFDHLEGKEFNISQASRKGYSNQRVLDEVSKCELVCANCHAERTHGRLV